MKPLRRSAEAIADIEDCLLLSLTDFGELAAERYAELLSVALEDIQENPDLIGSSEYDEFPHIRSVHLRYFRDKAKIDGVAVKKPRHFVVYSELEEEIVVIRVLHERMQVERHLDSDELH